MRPRRFQFCSQLPECFGLFVSKHPERRNSLSRRFSRVRLARHPKSIFTRLAAFEDGPSKCHRASDIVIFINEPNPTEAQRNRRFFNSLPFARIRINGAAKSLEHWFPLVFPQVYLSSLPHRNRDSPCREVVSFRSNDETISRLNEAIFLKPRR